ncbi:hypothetical protein FB645_005103 [Coemansia sp. IMI 203386]|nr:hypothetical protein FB645_005103 [Coemansia sp. IMI 203386]
MAAVSDNVEYCVVDLYDRSLRNFLNVEYRERPYLMYYEKGVQMPVPQHIVVLFANAVDAIFS